MLTHSIQYVWTCTVPSYCHPLPNTTFHMVYVQSLTGPNIEHIKHNSPWIILLTNMARPCWESIMEKRINYCILWRRDINHNLLKSGHFSTFFMRIRDGHYIFTWNIQREMLYFAWICRSRSRSYLLFQFFLLSGINFVLLSRDRKSPIYRAFYKQATEQRSLGRCKFLFYWCHP